MVTYLRFKESCALWTLPTDHAAKWKLPAKHGVPRTPSTRENLCTTHANSQSRLNIVGNMSFDT